MRDAATNKYDCGEKLISSKCRDKNDVLAFMKSFEPCAVAAGHFQDVKTGEDIEGLIAYESDDWYWTNRDTYHVEKYDLELDSEFVAYALSH